MSREQVSGTPTDSGIWFRSEINGLWYRDYVEAGSVDRIWVSGHEFYPKIYVETLEEEFAQHED